MGEAALLLAAVAVPIVVDLRSLNRNDVKDATLGMAVALGLATALLAGLRRGRLDWVRSPINTAVLVYLGWAAVTVLLARYRYAAISEYGRLAAHAGLFGLAVLTLRDLSQLWRLVGAACGAAAVVCA